jgi:hypothetical protein
VQPSAAVAHEQAARGVSKKVAKRIDAVLQWHEVGQKLRWPGRERPDHHIRSRKTRLPEQTMAIRTETSSAALIEINDRQAKAYARKTKPAA